MKNLEHLGIAVKDIDAANELFTKLLGKKPHKKEEVVLESVITSFFQVGETKIELLEATSESSAIAKFIEKRGEGLHHIAFEVEDIHQEMKRLRQEGFVFTRDEPMRGADNKLVVFVHPQSAHSVLIELCQEIK